jgi:hypothetical protein
MSATPSKDCRTGLSCATDKGGPWRHRFPTQRALVGGPSAGSCDKPRTQPDAGSDTILQTCVDPADRHCGCFPCSQRRTHPANTPHQTTRAHAPQLSTSLLPCPRSAPPNHTTSAICTPPNPTRRRPYVSLWAETRTTAGKESARPATAGPSASGEYLAVWAMRRPRSPLSTIKAYIVPAVSSPARRL